MVRSPVLFHVASHFYVGFGPYFRYELLDLRTLSSGDPVDPGRNWTIGLSSYLGSWF